MQDSCLEENFNSCFYSTESILSTDLLTIPDGSEKEVIKQKTKILSMDHFGMVQFLLFGEFTYG